MLDETIKELIAIGASISANCHPCIKFHAAKARELKIDEEEILRENYDVFVKEIDNIGYTVKVKDRIIILNPNFIIDENTFRKVKDESGNFKICTDFPIMVNEFYEWMRNNKYKCKEIYDAFHGDNFENIST